MKLPAQAILVAFFLIGHVAETKGVPIQYIDGRVCLRCQILARDKQLEAYLIVDLGMAGTLVLDRDASSLLEVQRDDLLNLVFQRAVDYQQSGQLDSGQLKSLPFRTAGLSYLHTWTTEHAQALNDIPVWGILGLKAFRGSSVWLDIQARKLEYGPIAIPTESWEKLTYTSTQKGRYRLEIEPLNDYRLQASFTTRLYETRIDAVCAAIAEAPGGNFEHCRLGPLNLSEFTAIRPVSGLRQFHAQVGNSFWQNFQMLIDPEEQAIWLLEKPDRLSDLHEGQYFEAVVEEDIDPKNEKEEITEDKFEQKSKNIFVTIWNLFKSLF